MRSFHQSKRSDNKRYFFFENLTYFFIPWSGRKYSHINSYNSSMTVITQDDHLPAGAWAAYALHGLIFLILETVAANRERGLFFLEAYFFPLIEIHK